MTTPRISVLMTAYNREQYIADAIESVLAQTWADFELVVVDDRSTDRTPEIAARYTDDPRVRVVVNERNLGDYPNRNYAATLARGEFLKYHDSDDVMYAHCLQVMARYLIPEPRAAFALSGSRAWPGGSCPMLLTPNLAYEREFLGGGLFHLGPAAALFRATTFRELGGFDPAPYASDYRFWIRACSRVSVLLIPGDLFYYRVHAGQEAAKPRNDLAYANATGEAWRMLSSDECPLARGPRELAKRNLAFSQARGIYRHLRHGRLSSAVGIVRHAGLTPLEWMRYCRPPRRSQTAGTPREGSAQ